MRNRNRYDRTGSSQDFSNNEGYHDYEDYINRDREDQNPSGSSFSDRQRSNWDDGMARSEGNNYRSDRLAGRQDRFQQDYPQQDRSSQNRSERWQRPANDFTGRFDQDYSTRRALEDQDRGSARYQTHYGAGSPYQKPQSLWNSSNTGHSGKGPKGYRRSDERIQEDVCENLSHHSEIDASEIEVDVKDGVVTLSGTVESRQIKRMTEHFIEDMSGVTEVKNDLRVMATTGLPASSSADYGTASTDSSSRTNSATGPKGPVRTATSSSSTTNGKSVQ